MNREQRRKQGKHVKNSRVDNADRLVEGRPMFFEKVVCNPVVKLISWTIIDIFIITLIIYLANI